MSREAPTLAENLKVIENACAVLTLRHSYPDDEWAQGQADRLAKGLTEEQLAAAIVQAGAAVYTELKGASDG